MRMMGLSPDLDIVKKILRDQLRCIHQMQQRYVYEDPSVWPPAGLPYSSDDLIKDLGAIRGELIAATEGGIDSPHHPSATATEDIIRLTRFIERNPPQAINELDRMGKEIEGEKYVPYRKYLKTPLDKLPLEPPEDFPATGEQRVLEFLQMITRLHAFDNVAMDRNLDREFARAVERRAMAGGRPVVAAEEPEGIEAVKTDIESDQQTQRKPKRSTHCDEAREKIISGLTEHHKYDSGSCLNADPIGNNTLAKRVGVSNSSCSRFFNKAFGGYDKYKVVCRDPARLIAAIKCLRGEYSPRDFC